MGAVRDLVNELRSRGIVVHEWSGWDGRGNQNTPQIAPLGAIIHHTGSNYGSAYPELVSSTRPGLVGGCLANFSGNADGSLTVLASGLAWHAGGGYGPDQGPLWPYANNRNYYTVGLEIVYPGTSPMTDEQYTTALKFSKTVADMFADGDVDYIRGHFEVNGYGYEGKWDPGQGPNSPIDMYNFRDRASRVFQEDDVTPTDIEAVAKRTVELLMNQPLKMKQYPSGVSDASVQVVFEMQDYAPQSTNDLVKQVQKSVDALKTGTGYTLEQLVTAVADEIYKRLKQ